MTRRALIHFLLSLTFLSTHIFFFSFFGFFSFPLLFLAVPFLHDMGDRDKSSESSVRDLDHRLRENFIIALIFDKAQYK
jgi:hypothetical protein